MDPITQETLKRYFNGRCTPEEEVRVTEWLAQTRTDDQEKDVFHGVNEQALKASVWEHVKPSTKEEGRFATGLMLKIAASLLCIALAAGFIYRYSVPGTRAEQPMAAAAYKVITAPYGQTVKLMLTDGTVVHLNAGSELRMPVIFQDTLRTIHLRGEAYLEVAKDAARPFTVVTAGATVRVLGTVFNVRAYPDESLTTVTVEEGKVRVSNTSGRHVLLTRNQAAVCSTVTGELESHNVYADNYTGWRMGVLSFKDQPLTEIAAALERRYAIQVVIQNRKMATHRFTGKFNNPALATLVENMSMVMQFQYTLQEKRLVIY